MQRLLGLGLVLSASAAAAEPPVASNFALREVFAAPVPEPAFELSFESPRIDYSEPARPNRKQGFLAAFQLTPNSLIGIGLSGHKPQRSGLAPDPGRDGRRGGKKLALRFSLRF